MQQSPRIAILISGTGTNMHAILNAIKDGELDAVPVFVGSDKAAAKGLRTAASLGVPTRVFSYKELGKADAEEAIALATLAGLRAPLRGTHHQHPSRASAALPRRARHPGRMGRWRARDRRHHPHSRRGSRPRPDTRAGKRETRARRHDRDARGEDSRRRAQALQKDAERIFRKKSRKSEMEARNGGKEKSAYLRMGQDRRARTRKGARGPRIRNSVQLGHREIS